MREGNIEAGLAMEGATVKCGKEAYGRMDVAKID